MQPPIPLGTLLQQRYRVTKILGQGGFGRTYLAQDTACFDEMCVLKEFSPNDRGRDALKKSKELFQREAQVLYQIDHPQIPKFRANFEEQKRLFLVQEYAEGKTVAKTLSERLKAGNTFTEAEAVEFLDRMLPVLAHIHSMGIIHRDISPDNIIFRDRDKLPVLIDFGVVKAGVTQLEASTQIHQGTTVGKAGYAPGEQLQTGEAYANSDLYALAVTVVVMMTGRKPESLIDKTTMTWKWHQWVPTLTPWFAKILNKMLSRMPNSRYQSATEVMQALRAVSDFIGVAATQQQDTFSSNSTIDPPSSNSGSSRYAASSSPASANNSPPLSRSRPVSKFKPIPPPPVRSQNPLTGLLNTPWGTAIGAVIAFIIFIVPLLLFLRSMTPSKTKSNLPTPTTTTNSSTAPTTTDPNPSQTPTPDSTQPSTSPVANPIVAAEALTLEAGKPTIKEGTIEGTQPKVFSVNLSAGQQIKATLIGNPAGVTMSILAPNQANVDAFAKNTISWQGTAPLAGEYRIEILPLPGGAISNFKLEISTNVAPGNPAPTPGAVVAPEANPTPGTTPPPAGTVPTPGATPAPGTLPTPGVTPAPGTTAVPAPVGG